MKLHEVVKQACEDERVNLRKMALKVGEVEQLTKLLPKTTQKGLEVKIDMGDESIDIYMPFDIPRIKKFLKQMGNLGWDTGDYRRDRIGYHLSHDDTDGSVWLFLKFDMEGATCVRNKIGTKLEEREVDVFEVVCKEGAEEMA